MKQLYSFCSSSSFTDLLITVCSSNDFYDFSSSMLPPFGSVIRWRHSCKMCMCWITVVSGDSLPPVPTAPAATILSATMTLVVRGGYMMVSDQRRTACLLEPEVSG